MTPRRSRPIRKYQVERAALGGVDDAHAVVRAPDRDRRVGRVVEEERVAAARDQQRDADVGARAVAEMVFQSWRAVPEPVEAAAALAQAVEVLLAREGEAGAEPAPAGAVDDLGGHAPVGRLAEQPLAAGIEKAERSGSRSRSRDRPSRHARRLPARHLERRGAHCRSATRDGVASPPASATRTIRGDRTVTVTSDAPSRNRRLDPLASRPA